MVSNEKSQSGKGGMARLLRPTLVITLFIIGGQLIGFVTQIVIAASFGARADMDAFLAANTLPQYVNAVLLGALGSVFVPVFIDYWATGREDEAWKIAFSFINLCVLALGMLALVGVLFARPLLRFTTPGLSPESIDLASQVAIITWPTILATGALTLLTAIYQVQGRFAWQAAAPVIGSVVNLVLVLALAHRLGVIGLAIAATTGVAVQVVLLFPILLNSVQFRLSISWKHPGVRRVLQLLVPLVLSGLFVRFAPLLDRYLGSGLVQGSISRLGYASKLLAIVVMLVSTGIVTVVFPRMAFNLATDDMEGFRRTISLSLRNMWLVIAPTIVIGCILSHPLIATVFQRGNFTPADTAVVARLLQIYLLGLAGLCLAQITGRGLFALKMTTVVAVISALEAVAYVFYTYVLTQKFGIDGIVWGYIVYFNGSLLWQLFLIRYKTGNPPGSAIFASFTRTGLSSLLGGAVSLSVTFLIPSVWLQLFVGGTLGLMAYAFSLKIIGSTEARIIWERLALR